MYDSVPRVCVGIPVYNGEDYLREALDSLLAQTYGDFEVVVSDNASTDSTERICRAYAARDPRIRYTRTGCNIGAGPNFNRVFGFCRSPYFKWMPYDDTLAPEWLARTVALLDGDSRAVLAHTAVRMVDEEGLPLEVRADGKVIDRRGKDLLLVEPLHLAEGACPADRFRDVLRRMTWCVAGLGLIRAEALRRTHLHGDFYGGDSVAVAELALLGRFRQSEEPLFLKRCHGTISVHKTWRERARWINPTGPAGLPWLRMRMAYLRALTVTDLSLSQRLSCLGTVARVSARNPLLYRLLPFGLRSLPVVGDWLRERAQE